MRSSNLSLAMAAAVILLLVLTAMEVEAIRVLGAESHASVSNQMVNKSSDNALKASNKSAVGETKRSIAAEEVRAVAHKLPEFHEDYYGPSDHTPRHH